jgi:hypothetical protein
MTTMDQWQLENDRYLSATVKWVRLCLTRLIQNAELPQTMESSSTSGENLEKQISEIEIEMKSFEEGNPPPAAIELQQQLGLSRFELQVLLLCTAMEFDTRVAGLCAQAQNDLQRPYPTFALALALFDEPAWEALSTHRPLRYWRLIEIHQPGAQPLTTSALRADERIVNYLKGLNTLDDRLAAFISPIAVTPSLNDALPPSHQAIVDEIVRHWQRVPGNTPLPIVQMVGSDSISKQWIAVHAAGTYGRYVYRLSAGSLPAQASDLETLARLWQRESILLPLALYVHAEEVDHTTPEQSKILGHFLQQAHGVVLLATPESWPQLPRANFSVDTNEPTTAEQRAAWQQHLGGEYADTAGRLAAQFNLPVATIAEVAQSVVAEGWENAQQLEEKLWDTSCLIARPHLDALAQRINSKATWDDIVLPSQQLDLLHQIAHQVRDRHMVYEDWGFARKMNRGLGISALFAGDSGTGKTMAAEVIANELRMNLYRIDLSAVVSKYIGETEKNLRKLFVAAKHGCAILFFDEADALFGKRSEVKDSHDRYANIEINYLLQLMESYQGLAILATNDEEKLDKAFERRIRFKVQFPFPRPSERKLIWQKVFPAQVPKEELDYERLAREDINGGSIYKIALTAAFSAAHSDSSVTMPILLSAVQTELRQLNRLV